MGVKKIVSPNPNARRPVRWEAMWYVEGRQVTKRFDTKAQAAAWEAQVRHEVAAGRYISARDGAQRPGSWRALAGPARDLPRPHRMTAAVRGPGRRPVPTAPRPTAAGSLPLTP